MKNHFYFKKIATLIITLFVFTAFSIEAKANTKFDRYKNIIAQKLTEKLRVDLSDETVSVKLNIVKDREISKNKIDFDGSALAIVKDDNTELPLEFQAKVNLINQDVEDVSYQFVESVSEFAPSIAEDNLMRELMTKISKDYKTTNIVISIDGFDTAKLSSSQTKYQGIGEVRIGDFEWSKIKFDVVIDTQNNTATKILYEVQK